jgi:RNA-binding protein
MKAGPQTPRITRTFYCSSVLGAPILVRFDQRAMEMTTPATCMVPPTKKEIRQLKARAQTLKAALKVGRQGLSLEFLQALDQALQHHELLKVKFDEFKEQKHELAPQLAEKSGSFLVTMVGNVAVLYRPKPQAGAA